MSVQLEELDGLQRKLTIQVPAEEVSKAYKQHLVEIAKTIKLPGFRPGKVTTEVLEMKFKQQLCEEVAGKLTQS